MIPDESQVLQILAMNIIIFIHEKFPILNTDLIKVKTQSQADGFRLHKIEVKVI